MPTTWTKEECEWIVFRNDKGERVAAFANMAKLADHFAWLHDAHREERQRADAREAEMEQHALAEAEARDVARELFGLVSPNAPHAAADFKARYSWLGEDHG